MFKSIFSDHFLLYLEHSIINLQTKRIKTEMLFKLSNLNSNLALTLGHLNPAVNNSVLINASTKRRLLSWRKICHTVIFSKNCFEEIFCILSCPVYRDDLWWCLPFLRTLTCCKIIDVFFLIAKRAMPLAPRARTCAESLPVAALCEVNHFSRYGYFKSLNLFSQIKFYRKVDAKTH